VPLPGRGGFDLSLRSDFCELSSYPRRNNSLTPGANRRMSLEGGATSLSVARPGEQILNLGMLLSVKCTVRIDLLCIGLGHLFVIYAWDATADVSNGKTAGEVHP